MTPQLSVTDENVDIEAFRKALDRARNVDSHDLAKQISELETIKKEKGLKALNDELFRRAGL